MTDEEIQAEWTKRQPAISSRQRDWFKRNIRCVDSALQAQSVPWREWYPGNKMNGQGTWILGLPAVAMRLLDRRLHVPKVPSATGDHKSALDRVGRRLHRVCGRLEDMLAAKDLFSRWRPSTDCALEEHEATLRWLRGLAVAYGNLDGGYYLCTPPKRKDQAHLKHAGGHYYENWESRLKVAEDRRDADLIWACQMALKGMPSQFSDFVIEPLFVLHKWDGTRVRMLNVRTKHGEVFGFNPRRPRGEHNRPLALTGEFAKSPTQFREWLTTHAAGNWGDGERPWQALTEDLNAALAWRKVTEVTSWGWHAESRSWFFGDCVITEEGAILRPNRNGYYRIGSENYMMSERDREGQQWHHGAPLMHPDEELDEASVTDLWSRTMDLFHQAVGTQEAYLAAGLALAYAAAPEIFERARQFPGLWLHGEKGQGKSWLARWLMHFWGFKMSGGVTLESTTQVGAALVVQQYSNLPVWFEEFQTTSQEMIRQLLKSLFDRSAGAKKLGQLREILTSPLVIGQATSADAATRSRYPHVQVSKARRLPQPMPGANEGEWLLAPEMAEQMQAENFAWLKANMGQFWKFGRWVLQRRKAYVDQVLAALEEWDADPRVAVVKDERTRFVYGVCFAGYRAMGMLLGQSRQASAKVRLESFRDFLVEAALQAMGEVQGQNELDLWWDKVEGCLTMGGFGETREDLSRFFKVRLAGNSVRPPGVSEESSQRGFWLRGDLRARQYWESWQLLINYNALVEAMQKHVRTQGMTLPLRLTDVRAQMSQRPYWVPDDSAKVRFRGPGVRFWVVDLDRLPRLGYRLTSDEEVAEAYGPEVLDSGGLPQREEDPRLGGLYRLVEVLTRSRD